MMCCGKLAPRENVVRAGLEIDVQFKGLNRVKKMNIEFHEKHLSNLGIELEKARARRFATLNEIRHVSTTAEMTKCNKAIGSLGPLNKSEEADGRLILSLERQIKDVKRQLDLARGQAAVIASRAAASVPCPEKNRWFIVVTPNGREVKHRHFSGAALQAALEPGYRVAAEIYNADDSGNYGVAVPPDQWPEMVKHLRGMSA